MLKAVVSIVASIVAIGAAGYTIAQNIEKIEKNVKKLKWFFPTHRLIPLKNEPVLLMPNNR